MVTKNLTIKFLWWLKFWQLDFYGDQNTFQSPQGLQQPKWL